MLKLTLHARIGHAPPSKVRNTWHPNRDGALMTGLIGPNSLRHETSGQALRTHAALSPPSHRVGLQARLAPRPHALHPGPDVRLGLPRPQPRLDRKDVEVSTRVVGLERLNGLAQQPRTLRLRLWAEVERNVQAIWQLTPAAPKARHLLQALTFPCGFHREAAGTKSGFVCGMRAGSEASCVVTSECENRAPAPRAAPRGTSPRFAWYLRYSFL